MDGAKTNQPKLRDKDKKNTLTNRCCLTLSTTFVRTKKRNELEERTGRVPQGKISKEDQANHQGEKKKQGDDNWQKGIGGTSETGAHQWKKTREKNYMKPGTPAQDVRLWKGEEKNCF